MIFSGPEHRAKPVASGRHGEQLDLFSQSVVVHHSHPGPDSLSLADFRSLWRRGRSVGEVRAHAVGGAEFRGSPLIDPAVWSEAWKSAFAATASELRVLARRHSKRELAYLACHFVNKMVAGKGLTWYSPTCR